MVNKIFITFPCILFTFKGIKEYSLVNYIYLYKNFIYLDFKISRMTYFNYLEGLKFKIITF